MTTKNLPYANWKIIDRFQETITVDRYSIHLSGMAAENEHGVVLSGSAGGDDQTEIRAYFELLERIAVYEAQSKKASLFLKDRSEKIICPMKTSDIFFQSNNPMWRYALSNGVAIHQTYAQAAEHAEKELLERDAILASWYGLTKPQKLQIDKGPFAESYQFELYSFDTKNNFFTTMTMAKPLKANIPLLYGFGCDRSLEAAQKKSTEELIQRIGFLYHEAREVDLPFSPTAFYLQEFYLNPDNHPRLEKWLAGEHYTKVFEAQQFATRAEICFLDLTSNELENSVVLKAISEQTIPVIYGKDYPLFGQKLAEEFYFHPVV